MKYIKEELEKLIFEQKLPYTQIGKLYGVSDTYIKKICNKLRKGHRYLIKYHIQIPKWPTIQKIS